ncbi:MAG: hypothetical protein ACTSWN_07840 [Promethearchaeota archaeon]
MKMPIGRVISIVNKKSKDSSPHHIKKTLKRPKTISIQEIDIILIRRTVLMPPFEIVIPRDAILEIYE